MAKLNVKVFGVYRVDSGVKEYVAEAEYFPVALFLFSVICAIIKAIRFGRNGYAQNQ